MLEEIARATASERKAVFLEAAKIKNMNSEASHALFASYGIFFENDN